MGVDQGGLREVEGRTGRLKEVSWEREGFDGAQSCYHGEVHILAWPSRAAKWPAKSKISSILPIKSVIYLTRIILLRKIYLDNVI